MTVSMMHVMMSVDEEDVDDGLDNLDLSMHGS